MEIEKMALDNAIKTSIDEAVLAIIEAQSIIEEQKEVESINKGYLLETCPTPDSYTTKNGTFTVAFRKGTTKKEVDVKRLLNELPLIAGQEVLDKLIELGIVYDKTTSDCKYVTKVEPKQ